MNEIRMHRGSILASLPADRDAEHFDTLFHLDNGRVERIVSYGQCSPDGFWYDQDHSEWVLVVSGRAELEVEGEAEPIRLGPGDYLNLAAHTRHRVAWTSPAEPTIWLAIRY